ncbi:MAG: hypothetical protein GY754_13150 [bacterium]|nr:hypothetical protein [bacterium]
MKQNIFVCSIIMFLAAIIVFLPGCGRDDLYDMAGSEYSIVLRTDSGDIGDVTLKNSDTFTVRAVLLNKNGEYVSEIDVDWSVENSIGSFKNPRSGSTVFTAQLVGAGRVVATHSIYGELTTGLITVESASSGSPDTEPPLGDPENPPDGRSSHADAVYGNKLFFFGGWQTCLSTEIDYPLAIYNTHSKTWETRTLAQFPLPYNSDQASGHNQFLGLSAVEIEGTIYLFGGTNREYHDGVFKVTSDTYKNSFYTVNPNTYELTSVSDTDRPAALAWHTAVAINGKMHVWGGKYYDGGNAAKIYNRHYVYDPAEKKWTGLSAPSGAPSARYFHCAASLGEKMYIFGGRASATALSGNNMHIYNSRTNTWSEIGSGGFPVLEAPLAREGAACAMVGDKLYIFGGADALGSYTDQAIYCFNTSTEKWETRITLNPEPVGRGWHTFSSVQGKVYIFGGAPWNKTQNNMYLYIP